MFITDDARGLYETLKERGVTDFTQEPTDHFYGTDMGLRDPFGNPIRILQQGKAAQKATGLTRATSTTRQKENATCQPRKQGTAKREGVDRRGRAAIKESARERKTQSKLQAGEGARGRRAGVQAKIAEMPRPMHDGRPDPALVFGCRPGARPEDLLRNACLAKDGKRRVLLPAASKFKVRYATFGFQPEAKVDDGDMWPSPSPSWLTPAAEQRIVELVKKAVR